MPVALGPLIGDPVLLRAFLLPTDSPKGSAPLCVFLHSDVARQALLADSLDAMETHRYN